MIHRDEWNVPHGRKCLCEIDTDPERGFKTGAGGDGYRVYIGLLKFQQEGDYQCKKLRFALQYPLERYQRGTGCRLCARLQIARLFEHLVQKRHEIFWVLTLGEIRKPPAVLRVERRLREQAVAQHFVSEARLALASARQVRPKITTGLNQAHGGLVATGFYAEDSHQPRIAERVVLR